MLAVGMAPSGLRHAGTASAAPAGYLLGLQEGISREERKALDREAKEKIKEFKNLLRKVRKEEDFVKALESLGETLHSRILNELSRHLRSRSPLIRREAARQIALYEKNFKAAQGLLKLVGREKDPDTANFFMECVGKIASRKTAKALIQHYRHRKAEIARGAVLASAKLKSKSTITPLILLVLQLELIQSDEGDLRGGERDRGHGKKFGDHGGGYPGGGKPAGHALTAVSEHRTRGSRIGSPAAAERRAPHARSLERAPPPARRPQCLA